MEGRRWKRMSNLIHSSQSVAWRDRVHVLPSDEKKPHFHLESRPPPSPHFEAPVPRHQSAIIMGILFGMLDFCDLLYPLI